MLVLSQERNNLNAKNMIQACLDPDWDCFHYCVPHKIDFFFKCLTIQLDENPVILRQVGDEISKIPGGLFTPLENQVKILFYKYFTECFFT